MSWDDHAATWDDDPAVRAYSQAAFESLRTLSTETGARLRGARVLDFGCGTGLLSEQIAAEHAEVVAVDRSPAMIEVLERKVSERGLGRITPLALDLTEDEAGRNPAFAQPFDLVVCSSVCAFLDDYPAAVATLARRLGPQGLFVQWDWELDPSADEPYGLSREQVRSALEGAGLAVVVVRQGFAVPFEGQTMAPLMGVGRRWA